MKKTRFTEEQMVTILREADQKPVAEVERWPHLGPSCERHRVQVSPDRPCAVFQSAAAVLTRALEKLANRLRHQPPRADADRAAALTREDERLRLELSRLTAALATGTPLPSALAASREREDRRRAVADELAALADDGAALADDLEAVLPAARERLNHWRSILSEETPQARRMLRTVLTIRLVFTPKPEERAVAFRGRGDYGQLFAGLIDSQALASPTGFEPVFWP